MCLCLREQRFNGCLFSEQNCLFGVILGSVRVCFSRPLRVCWCFLWKAGTGGPRQQNSRPPMLFRIWNERERNRKREGDVAFCVWSLSVLLRQSDVKVWVSFFCLPSPSPFFPHPAHTPFAVTAHSSSYLSSWPSFLYFIHSFIHVLMHVVVFCHRQMQHYHLSTPPPNHIVNQKSIILVRRVSDAELDQVPPTLRAFCIWGDLMQGC